MKNMPSVEFQSTATRILNEIRPSATFLTVHHYLNNYGEISDFSVCFHISYINAIKRSKELLTRYEPSIMDCIDTPYNFHTLQVAREELLLSFDRTLDGTSVSSSAHAYNPIDIGEGNIPGVKLHAKQDYLHIIGFRVYKNILMKGSYPEDRRMPKTVAKHDLKSRLPISKFVQFKLSPSRFHKVVVENLTIREEDAIRDSMNNLSRIVKFGGNYEFAG